jgi:hypothetical protein
MENLLLATIKYTQAFVYSAHYFLSNFTQIWSFLMHFHKTPCVISETYSGGAVLIPVDRQMDVTKLTGISCDYTNMPKTSI